MKVGSLRKEGLHFSLSRERVVEELQILIDGLRDNSVLPQSFKSSDLSEFEDFTFEEITFKFVRSTKPLIATPYLPLTDAFKDGE